MALQAAPGRRVRCFTIDADEARRQAVSPQGAVALAPAFSKNGDLCPRPASTAMSPSFRPHGGPGEPPLVRGVGLQDGLLALTAHEWRSPSGSGPRSEVFLGPGFAGQGPHRPWDWRSTYAFTPSGKLAFSERQVRSAPLYVDDRTDPPRKDFASSPVFLQSPGRRAVVFAVGVGRDSDLVSAQSAGRPGALDAGAGEEQSSSLQPGWAPDRLLLPRGLGPRSRLYIMRIGGARGRGGISTLL
jgi:hypothetical protein